MKLYNVVNEKQVVNEISSTMNTLTPQNLDKFILNQGDLNKMVILAFVLPILFRNAS